MKRGSSTKIFNLALMIALVGIGSAILSFGQCKEKGITDVEADTAGSRISLRFKAAARPKDGLDVPSRWSIGQIGPATTPVPTVNGVKLQAPDNLQPDNYWYAELSYTGTLGPGKYFLYLSNPTFNGCDPKKEVFAVIATQPLVSTSLPEYPATKANARADADLYVSGAIEGVRRDRAVKTIDLKFELPLPVPVFQSSQLLIPYIDLKASSNPKADADSLNTGLKLRTAFNLISMPKSSTNVTARPSKQFFRGVAWDLDGRIEGNKNLKFINGIVANKLSFTTRVLEHGNLQFYIEPNFGLELGRNMRTPVMEAKDQSIVRPLFGASAYFNVWLNKPLLEKISVQSEFVRRWSLTREVGVNKDGDNYVPAFAGKGPRDYVQTKFELGFNKYFGFAVGHEYGGLPPNFKLLNHKFTASLTFKTKLLPRPK